MKILFCQPIFLGNKCLKEKNINSLKSLPYLIESLPTNYDIKFRLEGWSYKQEYWEEFCKILENFSFDIECQRLEHNYGKAYVINKIVKECQWDFDYIFTCDSDIIFLENQNYFTRLIASEKILPKNKIGLLAPNQLKLCAHNYSDLKEEIKYEGDFGNEILRSGPGVAGGCFLISKKLWLDVGGYTPMGVFCGEDGNLVGKIMTRGMKNYVMVNLNVVHPYDLPKEKYRVWKSKQKLLSSVKTNKELEQLSKEAIKELWINE